MEKIIQILPKVIITENNTIYYWNPSVSEDSLYPVDVTDRVKDFKVAIDVKNPKYDLVYLNTHNQLIFINFKEMDDFIPPFPLDSTNDTSISTMVMNPKSNLFCFLFSNNELIVGRLFETDSYTRSSLNRLLKVRKFKHISLGQFKEKQILDIDIYESRLTLLTDDNRISFCDFYEEAFEKNINLDITMFESISLPMTLIATQISTRKISWGSHELVLKTKDDFFYLSIPNRKDDRNSELSLDKVDLMYASEEIPLINNSLYFIDNGNLFYKKKRAITSPQKVRVDLIDKEKLISLVQTEQQNSTYLALTSQGRVFVFGSSSTIRLIKNILPLDGEWTENEMLTPILLNDYIQKKTTWSDFSSFLSSNEEEFGKLKLILPYLNNFYEEKEFQDFFIRSLDRLKTYKSHFEEYYNRDFLIKMCELYPKQKYEILHLSLNTFKYGDHILWDNVQEIRYKFTKDAEEIRKAAYQQLLEIEIPKYTRIFPDYILLFHEVRIFYDLSDEYVIPLETYMTYLSPIIKKSDGTTKNFSNLFGIYDYAFGLYDLTDNLTTLSPTFLLALARLGVTFDFVSYMYLLDGNHWLGLNEHYPRLPEEVIIKIQSDCSLDAPVKSSLKDQVHFLVKHDLIILADRLIKKEQIPISKFLSLFKTNPELFSLKFRSIVLQGQSYEKNNHNNQSKVANNKTIYSFSTSNQRLIISKQNVYYFLGYKGDLELPGTTWIVKKPFALNQYFKEINSNPIKKVKIASYSSCFIYSNEKILIEGRLSKEFSKQVFPQEISTFLNLKVNETILDFYMVGEYGIIFLTSLSRLITFGDNKFFNIKVEDDQTAINKSFDVTSWVPLLENETIINFEAGERFLFFYTSQSRLLILELHYEVSDKPYFYEIPLSFDKKQIKKIRIHELGLIISTMENQVFMSLLSFEFNLNLIPWKQISNLELLPIPLMEEEAIEDIDINFSHALVLTSKGNLFLIGSNLHGELGSEKVIFANRLELDFLKKDEMITQAFAGREFTFISTSQGRLLSFGNNQSGQLGDGTESDRFTPTDITKNFKG